MTQTKLAWLDKEKEAQDTRRIERREEAGIKDFVKLEVGENKLTIVTGEPPTTRNGKFGERWVFTLEGGKELECSEFLKEMIVDHLYKQEEEEPDKLGQVCITRVGTGREDTRYDVKSW